jgi:hypothetical protein
LRLGRSSRAHAHRYSDHGTATFAPFLFHPVTHFLVGFGPDIAQDLANTHHFPNGEERENRATVWGASAIVGGWL